MLWCLMYSGIHKLNAQTWDIGVHTGGLCYLGDLNPNNPLYFNSGGVGIQLRKNLNSYWSLSGNFLFGVLQFYDSSSSNAVIKERNLGFYTPFYEYSGQLELNFFNFVSGFEGKKHFSPFLSLGLGIMFFDPMRDMNGQSYKLRWYATEGQNISNPYSPITMVVPVGIGVKYNMSYKFGFIASVIYRYSFSKYLDDVNASYPNQSKLFNDISRKLSDTSLHTTAVEGLQRGVTNISDRYIYASFGITYSFINSECRSVQFD